MRYSLLEYKFRKYIYLGNELSWYVPVSLRPQYYGKHNYDKITGVKLIWKIVNKKKIEDINSIVSILLKVSLYKHYIFCIITK